MYGKTVAVNLVSIVLASTFLFGLLPMSGSMPSMRMNIPKVSEITISPANTSPGNVNGTSSGSCCDVMGSLLMSCDFMVSQCGHVIEYGDSKHVVSSIPIIQSIYLDAVIPPPKA